MEVRSKGCQRLFIIDQTTITPMIPNPMSVWVFSLYCPLQSGNSGLGPVSGSGWCIEQYLEPSTEGRRHWFPALVLPPHLATVIS